MDRSMAIWIALRATGATLASERGGTLLRSLGRDVLLQRRLWREGRARWIAHALLAGAVLLLVLLHALGSTIWARVLPGYQPTLHPFLFLRDLVGASLLA